MKILVIDDEPKILDILRDILEHNGFQVGVAQTGAEGIGLVRKDDFDVALVDIQLPDMEGLEVINELNKIAPDLSCCVMTGYGTVEMAIDALQAGVRDFFLKPIRMEQLLDRLNNIAKNNQLEMQFREKNREIAEYRKKLELTLDQMSEIIKSVVLQEDFSIRFSNPNLIPCHEIMQCGKLDCPCYSPGGSNRCWQVAGTFCRGEIQGQFAQKIESCSGCKVFRAATGDINFKLGEEFNNMMHILESKNLELQHAFKELKNTHAQLFQQEKMASIGQLAAGVAHEINNPMGFITSNLGTLGKYLARIEEFIATQRTLTDALPAEDRQQLAGLYKSLKIDYIIDDVKNLVAESLDGADRVKTIVQNLKSFARVDENELKPADINDCIDTTLNIIWNELKYKAGIHKLYGELPPVICYPQQLNQVFMNILINAAQAISDRGEIEIRTLVDGPVVEINISDTGKGIPPEYLNRIFEPFFTTKAVGKGTGLGMSISYDIIKKHHGEITVKSVVGKGATFTIRLPVDQPEESG